jgi:hypothetical protein
LILVYLKRASSSSSAENNEPLLETEDKNLFVPAGFACLDGVVLVSAENISFRSDFSAGADETGAAAGDENSDEASILFSCVAAGVVLGSGVCSVFGNGLDLGPGFGDAGLASCFGDAGFVGSVFGGGLDLGSGFGDAGLASCFGDAGFGAGSLLAGVGDSTLLSLLDLLDLEGGSGFWRELFGGSAKVTTGADAGGGVGVGSSSSSSSPSSFGSDAFDSAHKCVSFFCPNPSL